MLSALRSHVARRRPALLVNIRRCLATETPMPSDASGEDSEEQQRRRYEKFLEQKASEPPTRPQLNIAVNENHGLYAFFRQVPEEGSLATRFETVESTNKPTSKTGRSWNATELRRKSFKDLHTLWYIVLRERNLLATQRAEAKRLGVLDEYLDIKEKDTRCRKTMARIKQILNERKLAYEQAYVLDYEKYEETSKKANAEKLALQEQEIAEEKERERARIGKGSAGMVAQVEADRRQRLVLVKDVAPTRQMVTRGRRTWRRMAEERSSSAAA